MIGSEVVEAFCQSECDRELGNATFAIDAADNALRAACNEHGVPSSNDRNLRRPVVHCVVFQRTLQLACSQLLNVGPSVGPNR
jgi:hypothetical protein